MQRVKIIPNKQKPWAVKLARQAKRYLCGKVQYVQKKADATICIGGDGTIYYANYRGQLEGKVIGIGSGSSHVCQCTNKNWRKKLPQLLRSKGRKRITLNANKTNAISDVVIHTHDYRVIRIYGKAGTRKFSFEGDGIIVATPTGSTAYAYSAGGPRIAPDKKLILLVPICPYQRTFTPLRVSPKSRISLWADRTSDLIVDGILIGRLKKGEKVKVKAGKEIIFA